LVQIIIVIIAAIAVKLLADVIKDQLKKNNPQNSQKRGEVIDLSNAWIDLNDLPYSRREYLLLGKELAIYHLFKEVLPADSYTVFPRVRLADSIVVSPEASNRIEHTNHIKEKSIDLLICNSDDLKPIAVINFETESEEKKKRLKDRFTRKALEAAGYPVLNLKPSSPPSPQELTAMLRQIGLKI